MQILQAVCILRTVAVCYQRCNADSISAGNRSEDGVYIAHRTVSRNTHIADHIQEQGVIDNVDEGCRDVGKKFGNTVSAGCTDIAQLELRFSKS